MAHEIAKLLLCQAETYSDRTEAIETALSLGMPLHEIESYLDWLDQVLNGYKSSESSENPPSQNIEGADCT